MCWSVLRLRRGRTMRTITGWLFDLYASSEGITLWLADRDGGRHRCHVRFVPFFYMRVSEAEARKVASITSSRSFPVTFARDHQREIYSDQEWEVLRINVHDPRQLTSVVRTLERHFPHFVFFNSDIPPQQLFLYTTGLFPLAFGQYRLTPDGVLEDWELADEREAMEYTMPELVTMTLRNRADFVPAKYRKTSSARDRL